MNDVHDLKIYANANGTGTSFGISNDNLIAKLKMLLARKVRCKKSNSVVKESKVRKSKVKISLAFEKIKSFMLTQLGT